MRNTDIVVELVAYRITFRSAISDNARTQSATETRLTGTVEAQNESPVVMARGITSSSSSSSSENEAWSTVAICPGDPTLGISGKRSSEESTLTGLGTLCRRSEGGMLLECWYYCRYTIDPVAYILAREPSYWSLIDHENDASIAENFECLIGIIVSVSNKVH